MADTKHVDFHQHRPDFSTRFHPTAPSFDIVSNDFSGRGIKRLLPESKFRPVAKRIRLRSGHFFSQSFPSSAIFPGSTRKRARMSGTSSRRKKRKRSTMAIAKKALHKVRKLERKMEVKSFDIQNTAIVAISSAGDIRSIFLVAQGSNSNSRDGNSVSPFGLDMRLHWQGATVDKIGVFRTLIFRDKRQVSGTVPLVTDVLVQTSSLSQLSYLNRKRFKILYDETFTQANDAAIVPNYFRHIRLKLRLPVLYNGTTATSLAQNGLFMISISNLAANEPALNFTCRVWYNDN